MATDENPFLRKFEREGSRSDQKIAADDNHCGSWLEEYEPTKEWIRCPKM